MQWYWLVALAIVVIVGIASRRGEAAGTPERRVGSGIASPTPEDIDRLLRAGRTIGAIKLYRRLHGVDLKAAKQAVEARSRELRP